jgi:hypothetical protein
VVVVAEVPVQVNGVVVTDDGVDVAAEVVLGVADGFAGRVWTCP